MSLTCCTRELVISSHSVKQTVAGVVGGARFEFFADSIVPSLIFVLKFTFNALVLDMMQFETASTTQVGLYL